MEKNRRLSEEECSTLAEILLQNISGILHRVYSGPDDTVRKYGISAKSHADIVSENGSISVCAQVDGVLTETFDEESGFGTRYCPVSYPEPVWSVKVVFKNNKDRVFLDYSSPDDLLLAIEDLDPENDFVNHFEKI